MMLMSLTVFCLMLKMKTMNPVKMSLMLVVSSLVMSLMVYKTSQSVFLSMVMVLSFSSGMMILFSYCSVTTSFDSKSYANKKSLVNMVLMMACIMMMLLFYNKCEMLTQTQMMSMKEMTNSWVMLMIMMMVMMIMLMVNKLIYSPKKMMMDCYLYLH